MWVRTQDKMNLIEVQGFQIFYIKNKDEEYWEIYTIGISLGKYKSKERALEVLDKIQERISPKFNYKGNNEEADLFIKTQVLAQYETWLKEGIDDKYGKEERYACLKCYNKLQEIKERITNEKEKVQDNQK